MKVGVRNDARAVLHKARSPITEQGALYSYGLLTHDLLTHHASSQKTDKENARAYTHQDLQHESHAGRRRRAGDPGARGERQLGRTISTSVVLRAILRLVGTGMLVRILAKVISDSGERDHVPRQQALEYEVLLCVIQLGQVCARFSHGVSF